MISPTNEQHRTRDMETRSRLTATRGEVGGGSEKKEGEGSSRGTGINAPWTWTTGWGLTVEGRAVESNRGKLGQL